MKPLDPRLLKYARSSRRFLASGLVIGVFQTCATIAFAWLVTSAIVGAIDGVDVAELAQRVGLLAGVVIVRAVLVWASDAVAFRAAARAKSELRSGVLDAVAVLGSSWVTQSSSARVTTLIGRGLDSLDDYFARYLPQLLLTALTTPILLIMIGANDLISGVIVAATLPLIPVFMILVGLATRAVQRRQWDALGRLSSNFLDTIGGLATLKIFGRERRQLARMRTITESYRAETMKVLRVSFLSGFVLELAASLSVALVAVSIGIRLIDGSLSLAVGLFVLLLAPEVFLPLRQVGANYHAAAEGIAAADDAFEILDAAVEASAEPLVVDCEAEPHGAVVLNDVRVRRGDSLVVGLSTRFEPGTVTAFVGPSGSGKSSIVSAMAGLVDYDGLIQVGGRDIRRDAPADRAWFSWMPQRPSLLAGTVAENVTLGTTCIDDEILQRALSLADLSWCDPELRLGPGGSGLSGGQGQRVAIARALYRALTRGCSVLMLDEPTSALDRAAEHRIVESLKALAADGMTVIVVSHRRALIETADAVVECLPAHATDAEPQPEAVRA